MLPQASIDSSGRYEHVKLAVGLRDTRHALSRNPSSHLDRTQVGQSILQSLIQCLCHCSHATDAKGVLAPPRLRGFLPCNLHTTTASQAASFDSTSKSPVPDPCRHPQQLSEPLLGPLAKVPPCRHFCSAAQRAIPVWVLRPCVLQQWRAVRRPRETKHSRFLRDPWPGRWLWCREGNRQPAGPPVLEGSMSKVWLKSQEQHVRRGH